MIPAWRAAVPGHAATLNELQLSQAVAAHETFYGQADRPAYWRELHNWGADHAGPDQPGHDGEDTHANGVTYKTRFRAYPDDLAGATGMVRHIWRRSSTHQPLADGDLEAFAEAMHRELYTETSGPKYAARLRPFLAAIAKANGEQLAGPRAAPPFVARPNAPKGGAFEASTGGGPAVFLALTVATIYAFQNRGGVHA